MIRKTRLCALLLLAATCFAATVRAQQVERPAVEGPSSFAVITDSLTYVNCRQQIALYRGCPYSSPMRNGSRPTRCARS